MPVLEPQNILDVCSGGGEGTNANARNISFAAPDSAVKMKYFARSLSDREERLRPFPRYFFLLNKYSQEAWNDESPSLRLCASVVNRS